MKEGWRTLFLSVGHLVNDMHFSVIPPILPLLASMHGLSYALAGLIAASYHIVSSFAQPLFGYVFDKFRVGFLISLGILIGGLGIGALGYTNSYAAILLAVVAAGVGSAIFHPAGLAMASSTSSGRRGTLFSLFVLGGNIGRAIGPIVILAIIGVAQMRGTILLVFPASIMAITLLLIDGVRGSTMRSGRGEGSTLLEIRREWRSLLMLMATSILRSVIGFGLVVFLPLYAVQRGFGIEMGGLLLFLMLMAGAAGTVIAGSLSDIVDRRIVASGLLFITTPFLYFFTLVSEPVVLLLAMAAGLGLVLNSIHPVLVLISHELLPYSKGVASSLIHGVSFGVANILIPFFGVIIDVLGFEAAFYAMAILSPIAGGMVLLGVRGANVIAHPSSSI